MTVGEHKIYAGVIHYLGRRHQINQWFLTFVVTFHLSGLQLQQHRGALGEVKRHVIVDYPTGAAGYSIYPPLVLNIYIMNRSVLQTIIRGVVRCVQPASTQADMEVVHVHESINGGRLWHRHQTPFASLQLIEM